MLVIFASNVKRSDTCNKLPIYHVLVIFAFSLKTRITQKFPARKLLALYSLHVEDNVTLVDINNETMVKLQWNINRRK